MKKYKVSMNVYIHNALLKKHCYMQYITLLMDLGGVPTVGVQWSSQSFH